MAVIGPFGIAQANQRPDAEQRDRRARESFPGDSPRPVHVLRGKREMLRDCKFVPVLVTRALPRAFLKPAWSVCAFQIERGVGGGWTDDSFGAKLGCAWPLPEVLSELLQGGNSLLEQDEGEVSDPDTSARAKRLPARCCVRSFASQASLLYLSLPFALLQSAPAPLVGQGRERRVPLLGLA